MTPVNLSFNIDGKSSEKEIAGIFERKFKKLLSCDSDRGSVEDSGKLSSSVFSKIFFDSASIDRSIDRLAAGFGFDFIHSNHLKYSGKYFRYMLGRLFSIMLDHSYLPMNMLRGHIRPVIKDKKICKSISANYRPVMNSCIILKVFEYALLPTVGERLEISPLQFGFTPGSDCQSAILFAKETILSYTGANSDVHCAAIDLSKAFDRVNFDIMLDKLCSSSLPSSIVRVIDYMLRNTHVNVCYGDYVGNDWKVKSGVRQGGILSPLLFNFYINECIKEVSSLSEGCRLCYQPANIICYADDVLLLAPSGNGLQRILNEFSRIIDGLRLIINTEKSNYIVFTHKRRDGARDICVSGFKMIRVRSIKYLGVVMTDNMSIDCDIDRTLDSFLRQFNGIFSKFSFVNFDILCYMFRTCVTSFYGVGVWIEQKLSARLIHKLSVAYHKAVKKVASLNVWDSNHVACERVGVDTMPHLIAKRLLSFYANVKQSKCKIISSLRYYFLSVSNLRFALQYVFRERYGVNDVSCNDIDALVARVDFVQKNEPRSHYSVSS